MPGRRLWRASSRHFASILKPDGAREFGFSPYRDGSGQRRDNRNLLKHEPRTEGEAGGAHGLRRAILPANKGLQKYNFLGKMIDEILMNKSRFTEAQIMAMLRQAAGQAARDQGR